MEKEFIDGPISHTTKDNSKRDSKVETELGEKELEPICMNMLDNTYEIKSMERVPSNGRVEINMLDNITMTNEKAKGR